MSFAFQEQIPLDYEYEQVKNACVGLPGQDEKQRADARQHSACYYTVVRPYGPFKAAYDNKYGAPSAGRTKIFLRYFFVNAVTGEKSADILREVELGATNDPFDEGNGD